VLAGDEFSACGAARDPDMAGGLSWAELRLLVSAAPQAGGCRGWSIGVYNPNPDLGPERRAARQVVTSSPRSSALSVSRRRPAALSG